MNAVSHGYPDTPLSSAGKPFLRSALLMIAVILGIFSLFPAVVSADMGPKPSITIVVKNAPSSPYYLDLLIDKDGRYANLSDDRSQYDAAKLALLEAYNQDGWYPALAHGTDMPLFGDLTGQRQGVDMVHSFSYFGTPERFKIIIVTPDNQLVVSHELIRDSFQMTLTYDYANGLISRRSLLMSYLIQILSTLLPTLLIEGLLLLVFGFSLKKNFWPFLLVNLATQVLMTALLGTAAIMNSLFTAYLLLIPVELLILLIESIAFAFLLKQHKKGRRIGYAIVANLVSALAGMIVMSFSLA